MTVSCQFSQNRHAKPKRRGDEAADELDEAGADEVPDALGVAHDARDEHAGLRGVEVAHRQPHHVRLDALAHVGDRALRRDAQNLRQRERGHRLHSVAATAASAIGVSRSVRPLPTTSSMSHLRRERQDQAGEAADEHQRQAERQAAAMRPDQLARFAPGGRAIDLLLRRGVVTGT